ncbi:hypothetical protein WJX81_007183 [Elliptochloris bilobata]|uniref:FCP1 homology domain-containing protein n=1 Tax=Elliptochloris bilobata TaxID=381761 RepID=A0AAW1S123_9CHLO
MTVVLDVDETLVCAFKPGKVPSALRGRGTFSLNVLGAGRLVIFKRPGLNEFLLRLSSFAEIVAFTAGMQGYAEPLLNALDPEGRLFSCRLYREATLSVRGRENVKDLGRLGRDLARVVLVDDNAWSFLLQPANGVPAVPYLGSPNDGHLLGVILPLLEALSRARDVRPVLQATFDMAGWFGRRGVCMYERPDRSLTAAAMLAH